MDGYIGMGDPWNRCTIWIYVSRSRDIGGYSYWYIDRDILYIYMIL